MDAYEELIEGYKVFRSEYLDKKFNAYRVWAAKKAPARCPDLTREARQSAL